MVGENTQETRKREGDKEQELWKQPQFWILAGLTVAGAAAIYYGVPQIGWGIIGGALGGVAKKAMSAPLGEKFVNSGTEELMNMAPQI